MKTQITNNKMSATHATNALKSSAKYVALGFFALGISQVCIAEVLKPLLPSQALPSYMLKTSIKPHTQNHNMEVNSNPPKDYIKCSTCHGNDGTKRAPGARGHIPIAGLPKHQIIGDLRSYKHKVGNKGGTQSVMQEQAQDLNERDIQILAEYISKLPKAN